MSSQLQDYFEEAVETVARLLYARNRTPREPGWMDLEPRMKEGAIRDARVVIDLWIKVEFAARDFMDAHEENENYPDPLSSEPRPENPYRTVHARMSPPGAAWDEGFAAGRAAATPDPPEPNAAIRALMAAYNDSQSHAFRAAMVTAAGVIGQHYGDENPNADEFDGAGCCPEEDGFLRAKARAAATPTPSDEEGWSPGIDDPEPPALGDIDTGEGWYQT